MAIPHVKWIKTSGEGDWTTAANWDSGTVPTGDVDVIFTKTGTYQVDITTAVDVFEIEMHTDGVTIMESSTGSITAHNLLMEEGTLELDGANDFQTAHFQFGRVIVGNADAFGSHLRYITLAETIALDFTISTTLHTAIDGANDMSIGASAGHTANLAGDFALGGAADATNSINFGGEGESGTIKLGGKTFTQGPAPLTIDVSNGTVIGGSNAADHVAHDMFAYAESVSLDMGATLDVRQFGADVSLTDLHGGGTLKSAGNQIALTGADFDGTFSGNPNITATGTNTVGATFGHAFFTMGAGTDTLDLTLAKGKASISAPSGSAATVTVGAGAQTYFTDFSDGHVTARVAGGAGDHISYVEGSGFTRVVVHDHAGIMNLYLYGVTQDDIHTGGDGHGNLMITVAAAEIAAHQSFIPMPHDVLF